MWDTIKSIEEPEPIQKKDIFFLGKELRKTRFYMDVHKKKKRHWVPPPKQNKQRGNFFIYFVSFWRHGRAVRRGTANPFSPVQIRVSPDQQKNRNTFLCFADIICKIFSSRSKWRKRIFDTCFILSIWGFCSLKGCKSPCV